MHVLIRKENEHKDSYSCKSAPNGRHNAYSTWEQVAGYFDGDGSISISVTRFGFAIGLAFADNYEPLLEHMASFLQERGFFSTLSLQRTKGKKFWRLRVRRREDTVNILNSMLPYLDKKHEEARAAVDYLTTRWTVQSSLRG